MHEYEDEQNQTGEKRTETQPLRKIRVKKQNKKRDMERVQQAGKQASDENMEKHTRECKQEQTDKNTRTQTQKEGQKRMICTNTLITHTEKSTHMKTKIG